MPDTNILQRLVNTSKPALKNIKLWLTTWNRFSLNKAKKKDDLCHPLLT